MAQPAKPLDGKVLFHERCASCHGPGGMGTGLIDRRVKPAELEKRTGLSARLVDERFTTAAALRAVREMGGSTRGRKGDVDALAATLLLQHALSLPD